MESKAITPGQERHTPNYKVTTLLEWKAPQRPFKKRTSVYFRSAMLIAFLLEIILFMFQDYIGMLVVLAFLFLIFAMGSVPPHESDFKISTEGFAFDDHFFLWQELYDFYFKTHLNTRVLYIRTMALIPGELYVPLGTTVTEEQVKSTLAHYIPFREVVQQTFLEKSGEWLGRTFPLEPTPAPKPKAKVAS